MRATGLALAIATLLAGCQGDDDRARADDLARRLARLESKLKRLDDDAAALRGQLDDLRRERDNRRAAAAGMSPMPATSPSADASSSKDAPSKDTPSKDAQSSKDAPSKNAPPAASSAASRAEVTLSVESVPPGARVYVDGAEVGTTPLVFKRPATAPGAKVRISKSGFRDRTAAIKAGRSKRLRVKLIAR